ncbi:MAG: glutamate synthase subunit alpha, partial [Treponema sp.]|nr:glutamate synthase subunit alpha [Treponema sp.]
MMTLYDTSFEHDNCGIGAVVSIDGIQSNAVVNNALSIVEKLEHRAGKDAEGKTGDGVGILLQICHSYFAKKCAKLVGSLNAGEYAVGMFFLPPEGSAVSGALEKSRFEEVCKKHELTVLGWRTVPVKKEVLGKKARDCMPVIEQVFIAKPGSVKAGLEFDQVLYRARRDFEKAGTGSGTYICS